MAEDGNLTCPWGDSDQVLVGLHASFGPLWDLFGPLWDLFGLAAALNSRLFISFRISLIVLGLS